MKLLSLALAALLCSGLGLVAQEPTPQGPVETLSPVRDRIVLNGLWKTLPAVGPSADAPAASANWGAMWVPGSWIDGFAKEGTGLEWAALGAALQQVWYDRQIDVPASWKGRKVIIDFRRVSTDASVSVNGIDCGGVQWPYGRVDITKAVTPGRTAELRVLVKATTSAGLHELPMGPAAGQMLKVANKLSTAGLIGEVFMLSEPHGPTVSDVFVRPSFRKKQVTLQIEVTGISQDETAAVTASMIDAAGKEEQTFKGTLPLHAQAVQRVDLSFPWSAPLMWSPEHPNLYTLQLKVNGNTIHDIYPQRFGFREFWVDEQKFFLNGQQIRLRPIVLSSDAPVTIAGIDGYIDGIRAAGFNIVEQQPINLEERGVSSQNREVWCEQADEKGFLTIADAVDFEGYFTNNNQLTWWNPGVRESYQARLEVDTRRSRNNPSVVMWTTTPNRFGHLQDQNPRTIGIRGIQFTLKPSQEQDLNDKAGLDAVSVIRTVDPTRPVYSHAGDALGDVYTVNHYLDLIPLQEREEWLSNFVEKGDMPYMAVEFGLPLSTPTFQRGRNGYGQAIQTEPLATEFCAIYLGPEAYRLETDAYRKVIVSKYLLKTPKSVAIWSSFHNNDIVDQLPAFQALETTFIRNTWRSWRAAGITGGMIPWNMVHQVYEKAPEAVPIVNSPFQPGQRGAYKDREDSRMVHYLDPAHGWGTPAPAKALVESNGPTLAWIAGAPENFYEKAHSFRPGQTVHKQISLINDLPTEAPYHVTCKVIFGGRMIFQQPMEGKIGSAANLFLPVSFPLPAIDGEKAEGEIDMEATIGPRSSTDKFPFRVFNSAPGTLPKVYVFDSPGKTTALLKYLGADAVAWNGAPVSADRPLLVVGRQALSMGKVPFADLEKFVSDGGRMIIMGQDPDWMRKLTGFRISRHVSRRFFPVMSNHPVTAGLDSEDFRDWTGAGTLVDARPVYKLDGNSNYGWHWGNQGSVSCAAVEKPHLSGWTPILQGEFDMAYSPLMELAYGKGAIIFCTLDLEDQAPVDPVADIVARRVLREAAAYNPPPRRKAVFIGRDEDAVLLESTGLVFDKASSLPGPDELAIVGAGATVTAHEMNTFASQGGNVLVLPAPAGQNALGDRIGNQGGFFGVTEFQGAYGGALTGLGISDLHFRVATSWPVLSEGGTILANGLISTRSVGKGTIVATQLDPRRLNAGEIPYFRFTRWRQTRALSQMLANLGGTFAADGNLFHVPARTPLYHPDYNPHVWDGDDPAEYYRW